MSKSPIEPYKVYTTPEAADALGTSQATVINEIKQGNLNAKEIGKGWKILGENLLTYMSSPTISTMQSNIDTSGAAVVKKTTRYSGGAALSTDE